MPYRAPFLAFLIHQRPERAARPADEMVGREDKRPPPGRLAAPGTVSCRALFLAFQIHPRSAPRCAGGEPSWVRLAGCIPGTPALQKMAARTMQLALELSALMDAGLLWRFTDSPPPGVVTWDTLTFASVFESRTFASSAMPSCIQHGGSSPTSVCESAGVIAPWLDMVNREAGAAQLAWKLSDEEEIAAGPLSVVRHGRTRKHSQLYRSYGNLTTRGSCCKGFAWTVNPADRVRIAWALVDVVGGVRPQPRYE